MRRCAERVRLSSSAGVPSGADMDVDSDSTSHENADEQLHASSMPLLCRNHDAKKISHHAVGLLAYLEEWHAAVPSQTDIYVCVCVFVLSQSCPEAEQK